jgi:hydroxymethylglutaryl-CoA lyase
MTNAFAAWQAGVSRFDGSLGGIGGRPHGLVEGAEARHTGNVASEDLLGMFEQCGVATGITLDRMIAAVRRAEGLLGQRLFGHLADTGPVGVKAPAPHDH